jgi:lysophospholipase L1-like esterase
MSWLRTLFNPKKRILFVGDSITASELYSYSYLIKRGRKDLSVDVLAKGGQTTQWMLENLRKQLFNKKYDKVYIYGGVNDSMNDTIPTERTLRNLQDMVNLINTNGAKSYIITGIEPDNFMDYRKMPLNRWMTRRELYIPMIAKYKRLQQALPISIKGATIIPKFILQPVHTQDGIHPTSVGQRLMRPIVENTI